MTPERFSECLLHIRWTPINYLVARVRVSVVSGLAVFLLNGIFNVRRL